MEVFQINTFNYNIQIEWAIKKHSHLGVKWSSQGMLRIEQDTMRQLFLPTLDNICHVSHTLSIFYKILSARKKYFFF